MNLDQVIENFTEGNSPYFVIINGHKGCEGKNATTEDITEAGVRLKTLLKPLDNESKAVYKIYCFEKLPAGKLQGEVKKVISNGDHDLLLTYCAWQPKEISQEGIEAKVMYRLKMEQEREQMKAELAEIKQLLVAKQIQENEEDDEDIEQQVTPTNVLGALINNPQMQQVLAAGFAGLVSRFFTPTGQPQAVAGIPGVNEDDERIAAAIDTLKRYDPELCVHLEKLAAMAENNTTQFKTLLNFL
jgi:hypothetical protein